MTTYLLISGATNVGCWSANEDGGKVDGGQATMVALKDYLSVLTPMIGAVLIKI